MLDCRADEVAEKRVGQEGLRFEFGMELDGHKPRMGWNFNHFYQMAIGGEAGKAKSIGFKLFAVAVVDLVAMAMALGNLCGGIGFEGLAAFLKHAWPSPEPHATAEIDYLFLFLHQADDWMGCGRIHFSGMGTFQSTHVSGIFNHGTLKAEADAKEW